MHKTLALIGCGKMGLPIAALASSRGLRVIGVDVSPEVVASINAGRCHIDEPGVQELLSAAVASGKLSATTDLSGAISQTDAVIVIVPVLLSAEKEADLTIIKDVALRIGKALRPGTLVSFETTLPVGTTRNVLIPLLEQGSRMKAEKDFHVVFSPERVKSLHVLKQLDARPKVVGGAGPASLQSGIALYQKIVRADVIGVDSLEAAELTKLAGMLYRDVNIALANELAQYADAMGVDFSRLVAIENTNDESHLLQPGIGVGGHCTPIYPYFIIPDAERRGTPQTLAARARAVNDGQAAHILGRAEALLGNLQRKRIFLLGLAFRPNVKEDTASPAYLLRDAAIARGAEVMLYDPLYTEAEVTRKGFIYRDIGAPLPLDLVVLVTAHDAFLKLDLALFARSGATVFVDGRNVLSREAVEAAGMRYVGVGRG